MLADADDAASLGCERPGTSQLMLMMLRLLAVNGWEGSQLMLMMLRLWAVNGQEGPS